MATVYLSHDNIDGIIGEVHKLFNDKREAIMAEKIVPPNGVGDELMSWVVSRETNKKVLDALPPWATTKQQRFYVKVDVPGTWDGYTPVIHLPLQEQWYSYNRKTMDVGVKGADTSSWDGQVLRLQLTNTDNLPQSTAIEFIKRLFSIAQRHAEIGEQANKAATTMNEFLQQHRTLQSALKECPAILSYVPDWMKQELERVPPKRTRRPPADKREKKDIDMTQLVTEATISKLNL